MIQRMIGAAMLRTGTYEEVEADTSATKQAMLVVVLVSLASGVGNFGVGGVPALLFGILAALAGWSFWAWITYFVGTKILPTPETHANLGAVGANPRLCPVTRFVEGLWVRTGDRPHRGFPGDRLAVVRGDHRDKTGAGLHVDVAGGRSRGHRVHRLRRDNWGCDDDIRVPDYTRLITAA